MDKFIEQRAFFPDKSFKPFAVKLWRELFGLAKGFTDVAVCNFNGNGSTVSLCLRDSSIYDGDYYGLDIADEPFVHVGVDGIDERYSAIPDGEDCDRLMEELGAEIRAWMEEGIMEAFHSAAVQKMYARYNFEGERFSIFGDCYEDGAFGPELSLLWSHRKPRFTVAQLRARQKAARKLYEAPEKPKMQAVKKKAAKPASPGRRKKLFSEPFKSEALRGWDDLFSRVIGFHGVIRFEIDTGGGDVTVITYPPEDEPQCVSMILPLCFDALDDMEGEREEATEAYCAWVEQGILDSFRSSRIQKKYKGFNPDGEDCAVVLSRKDACGPTEYALSALDLKILWSNNPKLTVARIKTQEKARAKKRATAAQAGKALEKKNARAAALALDPVHIKKLVKEHFKKPFKPKALEIWGDFFEETAGFHNIAHWEISVGIGSIDLTAQHSSVDESRAERRNNRHSSFVHIFNWDRMLKKGVSEDDATAAYRAWVEKGIMDAFNSKRIQNKLKKYNPEDRRFAVVSTVDFMLPLVEEELSLLWSNNSSFTVAVIKSQQRAAVRKSASG